MAEKGTGSSANNELPVFFDINSQTQDMAFYLAYKLKLRPNEILDTWGMPELIVAYGHYMNIDSYSNYKRWESDDKKTRGKMPQKVAVKFITHEMLED